MQFNSWNSNMYTFYWKEILLKSYYNIILYLFTWIITVLKIDVLLYFFAYFLLKNINTPKIFFSNILEIFWIYFEISIYISFYLSFPFICLNYIVFFFNSMYLHEIKNLLFQTLLCLSIYVLNFLLIYFIIFPNFLKFFLIFENSNLYFPLYFEARFEDYFLNYLKIFFKIFIFFNLPWIFYLIIKYANLNINVLLKKYKKIILISILLLSLLISPPDILNQFVIFLIFFFFLEIWIYLGYLYNSWIKI